MTNYVGFGKATVLFFKNYANFSGRSSRSEYWWSYVFMLLVSILIGIVGGIASYIEPSMMILAIIAGVIFGLICWLPSLSITIRRLHDVGKSGWFCLISLIPYVGSIILLIQTLKNSDGRNQWGPPPGETR